jgi:hypothetical protein
LCRLIMISCLILTIILPSSEDPSKSVTQPLIHISASTIYSPHPCCCSSYFLIITTIQFWFILFCLWILTTTSHSFSTIPQSSILSSQLLQNTTSQTLPCLLLLSSSSPPSTSPIFLLSLQTLSLSQLIWSQSLLFQATTP